MSDYIRAHPRAHVAPEELYFSTVAGSGVFRMLKRGPWLTPSIIQTL